MKKLSISASNQESGLYTEIYSGDKLFYADEPRSIGGTDQAPSPMEYFLASLASCTCITIRLYAQRKQWQLGKISVSVNLDNSAEEPKITKSISFEKELSEEQKSRLLYIAEKCPVAKLMSEKLVIELV